MEIASQRWRDLLREGAGRMGLSLEARHLDAFARHASELLLWNRKTNLTSITAPADVAVRHVLDSLAPAPLLPAGAALLDVGAGGGFPGIPLKIVRPDLAVTLVDAARRKVSFLKHVLRCLPLSGITAVQARLPSADVGGPFDVIVCRAFADLKDFVGKARPLLAAGGFLLAMKGPRAAAEVAELTPGVYDVQVRPYHLPFSDDARNLVVLTPLPAVRTPGVQGAPGP